MTKEEALKQYDSYLGDGVYASYDGYQIWLAANHHLNKVVALEPSVFAALLHYAQCLPGKNPEDESNS